MSADIIYQSLIAGLATVLGTVLVIAFGKPDERLLSVFLGFAGGVMTAVVVLDLLPSALSYGNWLIASLGFLFGLVLMQLLDLMLSKISGFRKAKKQSNSSRLLKMGYLIAVAIALHDLPEGVAIAVGSSANNSLGQLITIAIGLHNIPEGMATAAPLLMGGMSKCKIVVIALLISLFTPLGSVAGLLLMLKSPGLISLLLALAGGAMAYIVRRELLPEAFRLHPNYARFGFFTGACLILCLSLIHG